MQTIANKTAGRFSSLDGLRGVLALSVVVYHLLSLQEARGFIVAGTDHVFGLFRGVVYVFFALSGYVLVRSYRNSGYVAFGLRRVIRLWPTFAVSLLLGALFYGRWPVLFEFTAIPRAYLYNSPCWSLAVEFRAVLCMPILIWVSQGSVWRPFIVLLVCIALQGGVGNYTGDPATFLLGAWLTRFDAPKIAWLDLPVIQWLGRISFSLYLGHFGLLHAMTLLFGRWTLLFGIPSSLLLAWLLWLLVENPSLHLSRSVGKFMTRERPDASATAGAMQKTSGATGGTPAYVLMRGLRDLARLRLAFLRLLARWAQLVLEPQ